MEMGKDITIFYSSLLCKMLIKTSMLVMTVVRICILERGVRDYCCRSVKILLI